EERRVVRHEPAVEPRGNADDDRDRHERPEGEAAAQEERNHDRDHEHDVEPQRPFNPVLVVPVDDDEGDGEPDPGQDERVEPVARYERAGRRHGWTVLPHTTVRLVREDEIALVLRDEPAYDLEVSWTFGS